MRRRNPGYKVTHTSSLLHSPFLTFTGQAVMLVEPNWTHASPAPPDINTQAPPNLVGCPIHPALGIGINVDEDKTFDCIRVSKLRSSRRMGNQRLGRALSLPTELQPVLGAHGACPPPLHTNTYY